MKITYILLFIFISQELFSQSILFLPNKSIVETSTYGFGHSTIGGQFVGTLIGSSSGGLLAYSTTNSFNLAVNNGPAAVKLDSAVTMVNYTALGSNAPFIKTKLLIGTTSANTGFSASSNIPHDIPNQKIVEIKLMIFDGTKYVPQEYTQEPGKQASVFVNAANIAVANSVTNSANIRNKPFKLYITYEL
jgi:hypothetical protein